MRYLLVALIVAALALPGKGQKVLQIERYGSPVTQKLFIGDALTYRMEGDELWYDGYIEDILVEEKIVLLGQRYLPLDTIAALRWDRTGPRVIGASLLVFGAGWTGSALIGKLTDGDPDTEYNARDAAIGGTSMLLGLGIPRLFRYKKIRMGRRFRLRLLDLNFSPPQEE